MNTPSRVAVLLSLSFLALPPLVAVSAEPTATVAKFDAPTRPENWSVQFGHWEPHEGVLVVRELDKDNHAAAARWRIPLEDGVITLRAKFVSAAGLHVGFDPAPGALKKQGHLYSLVVTPTGAQIKRHRDKADEASRDETLATAKVEPALKDWITIELRTEGDRVTARVGESIRLEASDPTFHVAKPAVVFRALGGELHLDDVQVTVTKPATLAQAKGKR